MKQERDNIYFLASGDGVCVEECPLETNYTKFVCYDEVQTEIMINGTSEVYTDRDSAPLHLEPYILPLKNGRKSGLAHPLRQESVLQAACQMRYQELKELGR